VNRAAWCRLLLRASLPCLVARLQRSRQRNRKKRRRCCIGLDKFAPLQLTPSLEHLVGVHSVSPRHQRHTRAGLKCQFRNPPLFRYRSKPANAASCSRFLFLFMNHDDIVVLIPKIRPEGNSGRLLTLGVQARSLSWAGHRQSPACHRKQRQPQWRPLPHPERAVLLRNWQSP